MQRASGVLMHISSLPNKFGIGSFGESAYKFVDFLNETKQTYWQILPLTTTSYGDSPYQSFSAFAGNTHFIDLEKLMTKGYLEEIDYSAVDFGNDSGDIDYAKIFHHRRPILEKAVKNFLKQHENNSVYLTFIENNREWLIPFAEFMAIKEANNNHSWTEWDDAIKYRDEDALNHYRHHHQDKIHYHLVTQYFFNQQWLELKHYANSKNISIIGDLPIYVSLDSVEMWETPYLFKVDENHNPLTVSGTPPDNFSDEGQYWGNPIYDWEYMDSNNYDWWKRRLKANFELYDYVRIDHFKGFESFWEVPYGAPTAADGTWTKGPGMKLFSAIKDDLGELQIIAEDLGFLTDDVEQLLEDTGFPGMKILQFGFNAQEDSRDLPHHYTPNSIAYVGTHDNMTALGWYKDEATQAQRDQMDHYLNRRLGESPAHALNRGIAQSPANTAIFTMQDLLSLDNTARMNTPNTIGQNWRWRMQEDDLTVSIREQLCDLTETYFRTNNTDKDYSNTEEL